MQPTLAPGDYLICTTARSQMKNLRPGFVVVVNHSKLGTIVKRIKSTQNNVLRLYGDNTESTSTAEIGDVPHHQIKGHAKWAVTPKGVKRL